MRPNPTKRRAAGWLIFFAAAIAALAGNSTSATSFATSLATSARSTGLQPQQQPITVTSELVAIPVSVTDSKGNFVPGLSKANFQILEGNQPREIALFEQEDTPVSIGLLVDHSGSMESKLPNVVTAISGFTEASNPQDEMFVVNFGDQARVETFGAKAFTSDPMEIRMAVSVAAEGKTALYDAVFAGLKHLRAARWQKQALVIVSDGGDNASWYKYSQVLQQAQQRSRISLHHYRRNSQSPDFYPPDHTTCRHNPVDPGRIGRRGGKCLIERDRLHPLKRVRTRIKIRAICQRQRASQQKYSRQPPREDSGIWLIRGRNAERE